MEKKTGVNLKIVKINTNNSTKAMNQVNAVEGMLSLRIPPGCAACGGPYPMCKDSCPMFDD